MDYVFVSILSSNVNLSRATSDNNAIHFTYLLFYYKTRKYIKRNTFVSER